MTGTAPARIDTSERRRRLALRHHLAPPARSNDPVEIARDLVGLHATDPASVYLAAVSRMRQPDLAAIERALYDDRRLVRMLGMRRTMFVEPLDLVPLVQAACTDAIAARERLRSIELWGAAGFTADVETWLSEVEEATLRALVARGRATAAELAEDEPRLRQQVLMAQGKPYSALQGVSTRILMVLAARGRIVRGRPRGSWISSQYAWSPIDVWLPGGVPSVSTAEAQLELTRRWLRAFGPAPVADLRWWTGLSARDIAAALHRLKTAEVDIEGIAGVALADDLEPSPTVEPWAALLPSLDPTVMGWSARDWFLGPHAPALFDRSGNAGPSVWWDGRIVGGWAQRKNGEVVYRLLEDAGAQARAAIEIAVSQLRPLFGQVRVTPRFRTPLERELSV